MKNFLKQRRAVLPSNIVLVFSMSLILLPVTWAEESSAVFKDRPEHGAAVLRIMPNDNNIQKSNFGRNAFTITNTGGKTITTVELDVTDALYPDTVFDPEGVAGDSVAKALKIDTPGQTGIRQAQNVKPSPYLGQGGSKGYEGLRLEFDSALDDGFNPGETVGFSIDMDPNSIAGTRKGPLDRGAHPRWDVGGVSGAELIGSTFTVTFEDGTTATGQLHGTATQAGSHGQATENLPGHEVSVTVNDLKPGENGTYNADALRIIVNGPAGHTARVILTEGFIQPVAPYNDALRQQLQTLADSPFPANNAIAFQTLDVQLTGEDQDITRQLLNQPRPTDGFAVPGAHPFSLDPGMLPLGIVAAIVDPEHEHLPLGPVTKPIYLRYE